MKRALPSAALAAIICAAAFSACSGGVQADSPDRPDASAQCLGDSAQGLVWIEGGRMTLGVDPKYPEEGPPRDVEVEGFWISATEVTNAQFAQFVEATGYRTEAERNPPQVPGAPPEMLVPGSAVFRVPTSENPNWWAWVPGAQWRNPSGPGSDIEGSASDPVVQVTYNDALAYADWAGQSLPTEDQWEFAARAGEPAQPVPVAASGEAKANYYQGVFPARDLGEDGFTSRAPVGCFQANNYGLYDMIGNVWEWTTSAVRVDESAPNSRYIIKGGSFLCAANYCARYRPSARQFQERNLGTDHIGFRVVDIARPPPGAPAAKRKKAGRYQ
ncbi:MAG: formylglycine-generating enzyme family protein [Pseudomonadota bacterium]